jgi:hypothetical protein
MLAHQGGRYSANRPLSTLKSVLALSEEYFGVRSPAMPSNLTKLKKKLLTPELVAKFLHHARADHERGIYYVLCVSLFGRDEGFRATGFALGKCGLHLGYEGRRGCHVALERAYGLNG